MKHKRGFSMEARNAMYGRLFILPWIIGVIFFFIIPFAQAFYYSISSIEIKAEGMTFTAVGIKNYIDLMTKDAEFIQILPNSLGAMVMQVPIIIFFSLFVAILLKDKFPGRTLARALFFFPVIIASSVVIGILQEVVMVDTSAMAGDTASMFQAAGIGKLLFEMGVPGNLIDFAYEIINNVFSLVWRSGVQILLLMAALNSISRSIYEAAEIEGATEWEKLWKITFPMISSTVYVAVIYTIIDSFTDYGNEVMRYIAKVIGQGKYEMGTTISIVYFAAVMVIILIVSKLLQKYVFYAVD